MQKDAADYRAGQTFAESDEEIRDVLIAISVIAKRLARKIDQDLLTKEGENRNEKGI